MASLDKPIGYLERHGRPVLGALLDHAESHIFIEPTDGPFSLASVEVIIVKLVAPQPYADVLQALSPTEQQRIVEAIYRTDPDLENLPADADVLLIEASANEVPYSITSLVADVISRRDLMIAVATGGPQIDDVDENYRSSCNRIRSYLKSLGLRDPVQFYSLWEWYKYWSENLQTWAERRTYVTQLHDPFIEEIVSRRASSMAMRRPPTGWERVDRTMLKARNQLDRAEHEEDFQQIGLLCREILISLAQAVFDPAEHESLDGVEPSDTDARRMLEGYIGSKLLGKSNEELRKYAKSALSLASALVHRRTADRVQASLCVEATSSTCHVIRILHDDL